MLTLRVPALRERRSDIRLLARHFLAKFSQTLGKSAAFSEEALEALALYEWPGNIRELENIVERVLNIATGPIIGVGNLPAHILRRALPIEGEPEKASGLLRTRELEAILEVLRSTGGNMRAAAKELGIARSALYRKVARLGLVPDMWRDR